MTWKGVIIKESLEDKNLLDMTVTVSSRKTFLEAEEDKGEMHFHSVEVSDDKKDEFVEKAKTAVKQGWYIHVVKNITMVVIFRNRAFEFTENEKDKLEEARGYGLSVGILREQMDFENLIEKPFD